MCRTKDKTLNAIAELNEQTDRSLLIVEDDKPFLERLSRAMETRGFAVTSCDTVSDGLAQIGKSAPAFAVVDLRLGHCGEDGRDRLSLEARGCRRRRRRTAFDQRGQIRVAGEPDVGRSRPLGTHPAHLRNVQPQRLGNGAPAEHAPPYIAADFGQARAEVTVS
jgi:hypothetical protein